MSLSLQISVNPCRVPMKFEGLVITSIEKNQHLRGQQAIQEPKELSSLQERME